MGSAVCCAEEASKDDEVVDGSHVFGECEDAGRKSRTTPNLSMALSTDEQQAFDLAVGGRLPGNMKADLVPLTDEHPALDVAVECRLPNGTQQQNSLLRNVHAESEESSTQQGLAAEEKTQEVKVRGAAVESSGQVLIEHHMRKGGIETPSTISSDDNNNHLHKKRHSGKERDTPASSADDTRKNGADKTPKGKRRHSKNKSTKRVDLSNIKTASASEQKADASAEMSGEAPLVKERPCLDKQWLNTEAAADDVWRQQVSSPDSIVSTSSRKSRRSSTFAVHRTVVGNLDAYARESLCKMACMRYSASGAILYGTTEDKILCAIGYHADGDDAAAFAANSSKMKFSAGPSDSPSRTLASQKLDFMSEAGSVDVTRFRRKNIAMKYGVKSICCVPIGDGVLEVFSTTGWSQAIDFHVAELLLD
eukprot:TRINITY_DN61142_c0_g1_i1.p1 TRINITY_DN61142_c0_g1~~TRINITY_DN61142_c0_g1_i1.p1  ORF type:complete len:422 (-),score=74.70 TRINITY_DN61142_c0_g1_i1:19-1284(-)